MRKIVPWSILEEYGACVTRIKEISKSWPGGMPVTKVALRSLLGKKSVFTWHDVEWLVFEACTREACSEWYDGTPDTHLTITERDIDLTWRVLTDRLGAKDWWRRLVLDWKPKGKEVKA